MTTYVYHSTLDIKWEAPYDLGLFNDPSDAKAACQEFYKGFPLTWNDSDTRRSIALSRNADEYFVVARRPVR